MSLNLYPSVWTIGPQQVPAPLPQPLTQQVEKKWQLEGTIMVGNGHRKTLGEITDGEILWKFGNSLGKDFVHNRNGIQTITLKNAYVVNKIAGRVFDLEKITENDVKFSLNKNQLYELHNELQPYLGQLRPEILDKFRDLGNGSRRSFFNIDFAKQLNVHLKIPIDLAAAKSYAETKAEEEVSKTCSNYLVHASYVQAGKIRKQKTSIPKRPLSASSENPDAPPSKIQRPNANGQQTAFDVHAVHRNRGSFNIPPPMPVSNTSLSIPNASTTFLEIPPPIPVVNKPVPPSNESTIVPELNSGSHATNKSNSSLDPSISTSNSSQFGANDFYTLGGENWFWENTSQEWT